MEIIAFNQPINNINDEYLQIQNIIEIKRNMLLQKQKKLNKIVKQNAFLDEIKNDYLKYNAYILKQKQDQVRALNLLNAYIHDLSQSGKLSKNNIQDAKIEQYKIMKELNSIKKGLDKLMKDTNYISDKLH
jgi:hypothetical protein